MQISGLFFMIWEQTQHLWGRGFGYQDRGLLTQHFEHLLFFDSFMMFLVNVWVKVLVFTVSMEFSLGKVLSLVILIICVFLLMCHSLFPVWVFHVLCVCLLSYVCLTPCLVSLSCLHIPLILSFHVSPVWIVFACMQDCNSACWPKLWIVTFCRIK